MEKQPLKSGHDVLESEGRITYKDTSRTWSLIRIKRELIQEFPQLRERMSEFSYKMSLFGSYSSLEKEIKRMKKKNIPLPLLLFFYKEKSQ